MNKTVTFEKTSHMSFSFLVLGVVLGGIGLLLFLILAIVALASNNGRNTIMFSTFFLAFLIILVMSVSEMFSRVGSKIRNEVQSSIKEEAQNWEEERIAEEEERTAHTDWLKSINPEEYQDSLLGFFNSFDLEKNVYCIPMVYPYRLEMDGTEDAHAWLGTVNGKKPKDIHSLVAITRLSFDGNMMIAKRDINGYTGRMPSDLPEISYVIFEFRTGNTHVFLNQQALTDAAVKMGYTGNIELEDISTHYAKL